MSDYPISGVVTGCATRAVAFFLALTALLGFSGASTAQTPVRDAELVGVWRLVELVDYTAQGEPTRPMGETPSGLFAYMPGGHFSLHIQSGPIAAPLTGRDDDSGRLAAARSYIGYYGRWEANRETGELIHVIDGAMIPNRIGQRAVRHYAIEGDTLIITIEACEGRRLVRRLERAE